MMRIRARIFLAGPFGVLQPGQEAVIPDDMAMPLAAEGHVELLEPPQRKPVETEVIVPAETAVTRKSRRG